MTLIEERISKRGTLIHSMTESSTQFLSIRTLSGVSAGKSPPKTPLGVKYNTFLDYGRALRPAREYRLPNRIGFETSEDFETNCAHLRRILPSISLTQDSIPLVYHHTWDDTLYLLNVDGGNHCAAVYRQCIEQDRDFMFECRIEHQWVDENRYTRFSSENTVFIVSSPVGEQLSSLLADFDIYHNGYEFQTGKYLLMLGWNIPRAERLGEIILDAMPHATYFDLGAYINQALVVQRRYSEEP